MQRVGAALRIRDAPALSILTLLLGAPVWSQQVTGTLGDPGATTTINGAQLPPPDPAFGGVIKQKATESTP